MATFLQILRFLNLFPWGILAGSTVWVSLVTVPAHRRHTIAESARMHQTEYSDLPDKYLPICFAIGMLSAIAILIFDRHLSTTAMVFYVLGLIGGLLFAYPFTAAMDHPINTLMRSYPAGTVPANYAELRRRWDFAHLSRTACSVFGLACFVIATLAS
jgi:hypothetical protein